MEYNIDVMEGTRFPLCVTLKDGDGNAIFADGFRVYGAACCPGMGSVAFPVTRSGGEFVVMVPGLKVGRMPWVYQVFAMEQSTGVEWLLVSGEVRPVPRCAEASGGTAAGSLTVTGVLDKQTLSLGVQLGESTELCRSLVARAEEAARRAEEAAAGASVTLTAEEVQKVVPMKWGSNNNISIGKDAKAAYYQSLALGSSANANYSNTIAIGSYADCFGNYTIAIGGSAKAQVTGAISIGKGAGAIAQDGVAIGNEASVKGTFDIAIGYSAMTSGSGGVVIGNTAKNYGGAGVLVLGESAEMLANYGVALGKDTYVEGDYGIAVGKGASAERPKAVAVGANALANHAGAFVLGFGAVSKNDGEMTLKATNPEEGTSVSLSFMAGKATGYDEDMWSPARFVDDTKVKLTVRDELSGLQHSVAVSLQLLMYHLKTELQGVSEFGVVEGDGYGYGYGY